MRTRLKAGFARYQHVLGRQLLGLEEMTRNTRYFASPALVSTN
jgi:hypothetical protein